MPPAARQLCCPSVPSFSPSRALPEFHYRIVTKLQSFDTQCCCHLLITRLSKSTHQGSGSRNLDNLRDIDVPTLPTKLQPQKHTAYNWWNERSGEQHCASERLNHCRSTAPSPTAQASWAGWKCRAFHCFCSSSQRLFATLFDPRLVHVVLSPSTRMLAPLHHRSDGDTKAISTCTEKRGEINGGKTALCLWECGRGLLGRVLGYAARTGIPILFNRRITAVLPDPHLRRLLHTG
jgi:hypothetical protein